MNQTPPEIRVTSHIQECFNCSGVFDDQTKGCERYQHSNTSRYCVWKKVLNRDLLNFSHGLTDRLTFSQDDIKGVLHREC